MYKNKLWLVHWVVVFTFAMAYTGQAADIGSPQPKLKKEGHRYVSGAVTKMTQEAFFIKTKEGTIRNFGIKELEKEKIQDLKVGENLVIELDEGNQIIDIDRVADFSGGELSEFHQTVLGEVVKVDSANKEVTLKLKIGGTHSYKMKDAAATKMAGVTAGTVVLLELDEENNLVNDFDIQR